MIASALDAAADAAEAAAHRAQLRWEAEDWETAKADVRGLGESALVIFMVLSSMGMSVVLMLLGFLPCVSSVK